jgi:tRNA(fMet)-specific endonuclease VapC
VVLAELLFGAARHPSGAVIRREIRDFVSRLQVVPWDEAAAEHYGDIRAGLEVCGESLGAMDLLIAAHARSRGATLVSNDVRHFRRVEGLLVANWV